MNADKMNRRKALERTTLLLGGLLTTSVWTGVLHGCGAPQGTDWTPKFMTEEEVLVTQQLVDVIVPRTDTPGASDALVHRFIDEMLYGYCDPKEQKTVREGLKALQTLGFSDLNIEQRAVVFQELSNEDAEQDAESFFQLLRSMTLLGYFTSEIGATQALAYDPIPGAYEGCIPLNKYGGNAWSES